jgi:hypothetical protein
MKARRLPSQVTADAHDDAARPVSADATAAARPAARAPPAPPSRSRRAPTGGSERRRLPGRQVSRAPDVGFVGKERAPRGGVPAPGDDAHAAGARSRGDVRPPRRGGAQAVWAFIDTRRGVQDPDEGPDHDDGSDEARSAPCATITGNHHPFWKPVLEVRRGNRGSSPQPAAIRFSVSRSTTVASRRAPARATTRQSATAHRLALSRR